MEKRAVVLAGGGSRGAYQIGVWQALRELDWRYDIVTGASVGALNGALMVQDDFEQAWEMWSNLTFSQVLDLPDTGIDRELLRKFLREAVEQGGADVTALEHTVRKVFNEEKFRTSAVDYGLTTVRYPGFQPLELSKAEIPEGMAVDYMLASAACFPAFQAHRIGAESYIDGGYHDNMPVNLAVRLGAREIVAVDLQSIGVVRRVREDGVTIHTIRPYFHLGNFLRFEPALCRRNMALGYLDTLKSFGVFAGRAFTFRQAELEKLLERYTPPVQARCRALGISLTPTGRVKAAGRRDAAQPARTRREQLAAAQAVESCLIRAGELLELDPTVIYTAKHFEAALREALAHMPMPLNEWPTLWENPAESARLLAGLDRRAVALHLARRLQRVDTENTWNAVPFLLLFGRELPAALALSCLL